MARGNFNTCLVVTLKHKGGKVDNPADPGGRTNEGIKQRTYDVYRRDEGLSTQSGYAVWSAERDDIYQRQYWIAAKCDELASGRARAAVLAYAPADTEAAP